MEFEDGIIQCNVQIDDRKPIQHVLYKLYDQCDSKNPYETFPHETMTAYDLSEVTARIHKSARGNETTASNSKLVDVNISTPPPNLPSELANDAADVLTSIIKEKKQQSGRVSKYPELPPEVNNTDGGADNGNGSSNTPFGKPTNKPSVFAKPYSTYRLLYFNTQIRELKNCYGELYEAYELLFVLMKFFFKDCELISIVKECAKTKVITLNTFCINNGDEGIATEKVLAFYQLFNMLRLNISFSSDDQFKQLSLSYIYPFPLNLKTIIREVTDPLNFLINFNALSPLAVYSNDAVLLLSFRNICQLQDNACAEIIKPNKTQNTYVYEKFQKFSPLFKHSTCLNLRLYRAVERLNKLYEDNIFDPKKILQDMEFNAYCRQVNRFNLLKEIFNVFKMRSWYSYFNNTLYPKFERIAVVNRCACPIFRILKENNIDVMDFLNSFTDWLFRRCRNVLLFEINADDVIITQLLKHIQMLMHPLTLNFDKFQLKDAIWGKNYYAKWDVHYNHIHRYAKIVDSLSNSRYSNKNSNYNVSVLANIHASTNLDDRFRQKLYAKARIFSFSKSKYYTDQSITQSNVLTLLMIAIKNANSTNTDEFFKFNDECKFLFSKLNSATGCSCLQLQN